MKEVCKVGLWVALLATLWALPVAAEERPLLNPENIAEEAFPPNAGEPSDDPEIIAQCETVCATEQSCGTLPTELRGDCMTLCRSTALDPGVRSCMAKTEECAEFADCADLQAVTAPILAVETPKQCDKNKRDPCPGVPNGCGFRDVCCTQIFGGGGRSTRVHLCGRRHCPWYYFGQGPYCGCPSTKDVYGCG